MTIVLSPKQSELYTWLCANVDQGERVPTITEISRATGMLFPTISSALHALKECELLHGTPSHYCNGWIYTLQVIGASYEIRKRFTPRVPRPSVMDEYAMRALGEW